MLDWEMKGSLLNIVSDRDLLGFVEFDRSMQHANISELASLGHDFVPTSSLGATKFRPTEKNSMELKYPLDFS